MEKEEEERTLLLNVREEPGIKFHEALGLTNARAKEIRDLILETGDNKAIKTMTLELNHIRSFCLNKEEAAYATFKYGEYIKRTFDKKKRSSSSDEETPIDKLMERLRGSSNVSAAQYTIDMDSVKSKDDLKNKLADIISKEMDRAKKNIEEGTSSESQATESAANVTRDLLMEVLKDPSKIKDLKNIIKTLHELKDDLDEKKKKDDDSSEGD